MMYGLYDFNFEADDDDDLMALIELDRLTRIQSGGNEMGLLRLLFSDPANKTPASPSAVMSTISIPAGTLVQAGDFLEFVGEYDLFNLGNLKSAVLSFDGQALSASAWQNTLAGQQVVVMGRVYRVDATHCRCYTAASLPFTAQADPYTQFGDIIVANMDSNALDFVATGVVTATGDLIQRVAHLITGRLN